MFQIKIRLLLFLNVESSPVAEYCAEPFYLNTPQKQIVTILKYQMNEGLWQDKSYVYKYLNDSTIMAVATRNYSDGHNEIHWKKGHLNNNSESRQ